MTGRGDRHRQAIMRALPAPTETAARALEVARVTGLGPSAVYSQLEKLKEEGLVESRLETDREVPAGGLRGTRYRLTVRGLWRREGMV